MEVQFKDEIEFETIELEAARDVVNYSFIVQRSLMYLDLSGREYTLSLKSIITEEQCRMLMEPRRQILYTYHLDLPINLESSLRDEIPDVEDLEQYEAFHLGEMFVCESLYTRDLEKYIINTILTARDKIDTIRRYLPAIKLLKLNQYRKTALILFDVIMQVLCPSCLDSYLVVEFAITFKFSLWILSRENSVLTGYVLHHAMALRYNIWQRTETGLDPINSCVIYRTPGNINALLVFGTAHRFQPQYYLEAIDRHLERRIRRNFQKNSFITERRLFLMLQLFYYFLCDSHCFLGLLYIWRSIPNPYLKRSEICLLFRSVISKRKLRRMIEYYKFFIVEETDEIEGETPRVLQHLCRIAVRNGLMRNYNLPYGINMLNAPSSIKNYLNLKI